MQNRRDKAVRIIGFSQLLIAIFALLGSCATKPLVQRDRLALKELRELAYVRTGVVPGYDRWSEVPDPLSPPQSSPSSEAEYWTGFEKGVVEAEDELSGRISRGVTIYALGEIPAQSVDDETGLPLFVRFKDANPPEPQYALALGHNARIMQEVFKKGLPINSKKLLTKDEALDKFEDGKPIRLSSRGSAAFSDGSDTHTFHWVLQSQANAIVYNKRRPNVKGDSVTTSVLKFELEGKFRGAAVVWLTEPLIGILQYHEETMWPKLTRHTVVIDPNYPGPRGPEVRVLGSWTENIPPCNPSPPTKTTGVFLGHYNLGFEVSVFIPCDRGEAWWTGFDNNEIWKTFEKAVEANKGYIYVEVEGELSPPGRYGHLGYYCRQLTVKKVTLVRASTPDDCK